MKYVLVVICEYIYYLCLMELQLCIVTPFYFSLQHILNEIAENCLDIAINRSGCCLLQECIAYADKEARDQILVEIVANALLLSEHPFGFVHLEYPIYFSYSLEIE